ncbi:MULTISPECIES: transposase [unclassified Microbacterium]|uniref:transposase n=1 Tax=unclassified Microbacterium TaxID=2609290 RepID=UPI003016B36B
MADPTLEEIAAALYAGPQDDFVSSRRARADEVSDPTLAAAVKALRKPSIAAWVVNVFAQERAKQLGEALQLARELREAQDDLDAPALAALGRERRVLTRRLAETAADLAASRGERITSATLEAVEQSISAAFFDPAAAAAVASGRLVRALTPASTMSDIAESVAGAVPERVPAAAPPTDDLQERRTRREAERRVAVADKELASAERELRTQEAALQTLRARMQELSGRAAELETQLAQVRAGIGRVEKELPAVEQSRADAAARAESAAKEAASARTSLEAL